ncbi:MAG: extracellular solute-binding protein family 1 [Hyphomicrobiales bacterium]|nr:extracellular solute-binding protein family 1 [Hyphomicrobiales bacterium]
MVSIDRRTLLLAAALTSAGIAPLAAQGADMEAAKKEGKVIWYTSTPIETAQRLSNKFQEVSGIKVELFRSGGSAILRRFQQEGQAGRVLVDVITHSDPAAANAMAKKGLFLPFKPSHWEKVPDEAKDPDGNWVAQRLNLMTIYLRTDKVAAADRPKAWSDLVDPKYKGAMVTTDPSFASLQVAVVGMLAKRLGWEYLEKLRKNDIMVVQGNQQVSEMLKRGERTIAVGASDNYAFDDKKAGLAVETVYPTDGTFVVPSPTSVVKNSPNPNAAKAFAEFMLSDTAQRMFPEDGNFAARTDMPAPEGNPSLAKISIMGIDNEYIEKENARIKKRFNEIMQ